MKKSLISSLGLTILMVITSLFQPHQHNKLVAASQNTTDEGANGCTGIHCLKNFGDDRADLFTDQREKSSRIADIMNTLTGSKNTNPNCMPIASYGSSSCINKVSPQYKKLVSGKKV
ncbi:unnamed protein product [Lathyrus sativus]|nr:unnamed protein product [Lathyrus sativus]